MNKKQILELLDEKNQNLASINLSDNYKNADSIYIPVFDDNEKQIKSDFSFAKNKIKSKKGFNIQVAHKDKIFNFIGMGKGKEKNSRKMRRFFGTYFNEAEEKGIKNIAFICKNKFLQYAVIGIKVASLNPNLLFKKKNLNKEKINVYLVNPEFKTISTNNKKEVKMGEAISSGKNLMRILGALPPNILNTNIYAEIALELAKKWKIKAERVSRAKLNKYNLINAVSLGSAFNSEIIIFTIPAGKTKTKSATALIGKGLCYDSGGVQGKGIHMKWMKEDMGGSASVLGTILSIVKSGVKVKEDSYFVLALAENMMGSKAMRADDIYITGDGQSVEIIHTDAEGRLALADAISYVKNNFKNVKNFYTIATLTGSCVVALGEHYTGLVCNNEDLKNTIEKIGKESGEYMHTAPWDLDYDDNNSTLADVANLGVLDRDAGWIKAGLFLNRFIPKENTKFCHFDIAGSIDLEAKGKAWRKKGFSSGIAVNTLHKLLSK